MNGSRCTATRLPYFFIICRGGRPYGHLVSLPVNLGEKAAKALDQRNERIELTELRK